MNRQEAFQHLGIPPTASEAEVKKAYRKMAAKHHPDKGGKEEDFKRIKEAYELISDPAKFSTRSGGGGGTHSTHGTYTQSDLEEMLRKARERMSGSNSKVYHDFFNYEQPKQQSSASQINAKISITLEEAFEGVTKRVNIPGLDHQIIANATPGTKDGDIIHVALDNMVRVHLMIVVKPHEVFELDGINLKVTMNGPMIDFYTGASLTVPTIEGGKLNVKLPPNSLGETTLRIKGKGFIDKVSKQRGNLYVIIKPDLPPLTEEQIDKLKEILI
jgi:curved DNA-binding protein